MKYLLDSNIVVALLRPRWRGPVLRRLHAHGLGEVVTSTVVAHELLYGAGHSRNPVEGRRELAEIFADLEPLPLAFADAEAAAQIRVMLRAAGTPIDAYDVLIAGQAKARGLTLVTNNTREFARVEGLALADWLREEGPDLA